MVEPPVGIVDVDDKFTPLSPRINNRYADPTDIVPVTDVTACQSPVAMLKVNMEGLPDVVASKPLLFPPAPVMWVP
jgi:hypothetical protein